MAGRGDGSGVQVGWIFPLALLGALSLLPVLLPRAELFTADIRPQPLQTSEGLLVPKVVFIVIDGLSADWAYEPGWMPKLQAKARLGASGISMASFPTLTTPGLRALLGGRRRAPKPELPTETFAIPRAWDSVLARAVQSGRRVHVVGQQDWEHLFGEHGATMEITPYRGMPPRYDDTILAGTLKVLKGKKPWDLLCVHFFDSDLIGHLEGTQSAAYRGKLLWLDDRIAEMGRLAGPGAVFIVTGDHGQTKHGGHGGTDPSARRTPWVMWGPKIRKAELGEFPQVNSAPTLSALLGVAAPANAEGWPLLEAIELNPEQKAEILMDLLEQRRRRWDELKKVWPWLSGDFSAVVKEARGMAKEGDYGRAANYSERQVQRMDEALGVVSPGKWLLRLLLGLWLLIAASCCGAVWPESGRQARAAAAAAAGAYVALFGLPLVLPASWPYATTLSTAAAAVLLAVSLSGGHLESGLGWRAWSFWVLALAGVAYKDLVDVPLWAALVCLGVWLALWLGHERVERWRLPLALAAILGLLVLSLWTPSQGMSLARSLLPDVDLRHLGFFHAERAQVVLTLVLGVIGASRVWGKPGSLERYTGYALSWFPFAAMAAMEAAPGAGLAFIWVLCLGFTLAIFSLHDDAETRGYWLALVGLAFFQTMASPIECCFVSLGLLASWAVVGLGRPRAVWKGLWLIALALWVYSEADGRTDFSHISVAEGYNALGIGWHPNTLVFLVFMKHLLLLGLPMVPFLAAEDLPDVLTAVPVLGTMSAGSFTFLWFDRYQQGLNLTSLVNEPGYERMAWVTVFSWVPFIFWAVMRIPSLGELIDRIRKPQPFLAEAEP